ncbi:repressor protein CI [Yersinia intermedia]|uniref:LexA family transcriptional regulator n=1 Tax=Yersinia intermedia TaxID=631 RepID=UPI0005DEBF75|nr:LexA family transcriptional regulator [Yersinia intermedia]CNH14569.1 repressor protein CI [Yersinia intermedia]CQD78124.1 repressor protein CI [Yersinia intermedia]
MKKLSERLNHAMIEMGVSSQSELARRSGVQQSIISKILSGKNETSKFSGKLASALGISADWLINGVGSMLGSNGKELNKIDASLQVEVWDESGKTGDVVLWMEQLPKHFRAYIMKKSSGVAEAPAGAIVVVDPTAKPGNGELIVTKIHNEISTYRFLEGGNGLGFLEVDDSRIPLSEITDPSCILGVAEQIFVRKLRK